MTYDLQPAAEQLTKLIVGLSDDDLERPTPCPDYELGDLLEHINTLGWVFTAAAQKDMEKLANRPGYGNAANLPDDWRTSIPSRLAAMADAWRDPAAWEGMTRIGGGDTPGEVCGLIGIDELVVHGWDVARASGQAYELDDTSLAGARAALLLFQKPGEVAAPGGAFAGVVDVPEEAPLLDHVVALSGRDPSWTPSPEVPTETR
jgi:uncharacterized protein (TIGR03086 family)